MARAGKTLAQGFDVQAEANGIKDLQVTWTDEAITSISPGSGAGEKVRWGRFISRCSFFRPGWHEFRNILSPHPVVRPKIFVNRLDDS